MANRVISCSSFCSSLSVCSNDNVIAMFHSHLLNFGFHSCIPAQ